MITAQGARIELARRHFSNFVTYTKPDYDFNWHHQAIASKLELFAKGQISKMIILMPPQHGKSELCSRRFPAYILGLKPATKIAIVSYSDSLAKAFNRDIQRIIDDVPFNQCFPDTYLSESNVVTTAEGAYLRNSEIFETVKHKGFVKTVGIMGSLTGTPVDLAIIDDPFKDREEALSSRIREKVWAQYTDVIETRLHNDSQQLIVMTHWDEDDLVGRVLRRDKDWTVVKFPAIKLREDTQDPRELGQVLWPEKHSLERILKIKESSPITFNSLYQQEPKTPTELLVYPEWDEIDEMPNYAQMFGGDFGTPTAIVEVMWHNNDLYLNEIMYDDSQPTNREIVDMLKPRVDIRKPFIWDSAEPRSVKDLCDYGMNAQPAIKGKDSISFGIRRVRAMKIHVTRNSHNLKRELNNYQWMTHNGKVIDTPIDAFNHLLDAVRYVYGKMGKAIAPRAPMIMTTKKEYSTI